MNTALTCFKAYDIRGQLGEELNETIAYRIGRAYGIWLRQQTPSPQPLSLTGRGALRNKHCLPLALRERGPGGEGESGGKSETTYTVVIGADIRLTSEPLKQALANGLMDANVNVIDLGMTGTEEIYFATFHLGVDGGVEITASHNPLDYNGMKLVRSGARPISGDSGLNAIRQLAEQEDFPAVTQRGTLQQQSCLQDYIQHLLTYINPQHIRPLKLVVNAGNGAAGHVVDALEQAFSTARIPISFIKLHHPPDGTFPNGIPNPLLPECRADTANAVIRHQADMGIAWDGDFDRCFFFDENGRFVEGYYIVGLLAAAFLQKTPGAKIIHDPRLTWNTIELVKENGGHPIQSKTGHAFIKERMRQEDAVYGGEMSAHHYFRDFAYCDSGMIPWLLIAELMALKSQPISALVDERIARYPCSGEINFRVDNVTSKIAHILGYFREQKPETMDTTDGLSMVFAEWRFNLRGSNTEPVLRLNVESRADEQLVWQKVEELRQLIKQ